MDSPSGGRAKRQKIDKQGRFSALEKLRELKGTKRKYDVGVLENVYDTVDETEYTDRVLQRQEDDWIDDDDGMGYVEDGREIFDDEDIEDGKNVSNSKDKDRAKKRKSKVSALSNITVNQGKGSIRNMISNMPNKKKEDIKICEDDILSDIMSEINSDNIGKPVEKNKSVKSSTNSRPVDFLQQSKREAKDYFKSLNSVNTKPKSLPDTNDLKIKREAPKLITEKENDDYSIVEAISPKKNPIKVVKKKTPLKSVESLTQKIEEFNSQDLHFDGIDFDDDSVQESVVVKSENMEIDGLNVDDFLDVDVKDNIKAKVVEIKQETHSFSSPDQVPFSMQSDFESLPLYTSKDGSKVFRFYWWDAWEDRFVKPGVVFLFGKVYVDQNNPSKGCVSCCVAVRNIDKKLYLLPREYKLDPITYEEDSDSLVTMEDVYKEFNTSFINKYDIKEFRSKPVSKNYAFDLPDVPIQSEYLEVRYAATYPLPTDKYLTFSHIFGLNTSSLEILLLESRIKGPCWLEIKNPELVSNKVSWCKIEVNALKPSFVSVLREETAAPPPLVIATINTRTIIDPKTRLNMIVMLSCLVTNSYEINKPPPNPPFQQHFCIITRSANEIWPTDLKQVLSQYKETKLTKCESERELLSYFLVQFWKLDPDIVLGHDLYGYQQDLLIGNIVNKNIPNWSRLGRLRRTVAPQKKFLAKDAFLGRLVCDMKISSMELIRSRSYDLVTLCTNVLKIPEGSIVEIMPDDLFKYYNNSRDLLELVSLTMQDTTYILRLMFELNVIPLALQITQIAGNVMSRTLMGGRSERNEFLLLHAFTEKDYIVPDKVFGKKGIVDEAKMVEMDGGEEQVSKKQVQSRKKPAYSGGLVLDPKKGFYENLVLLMDFNSLYPSIIQEYNICFTTIKRNFMVSTDEEVSEMILPESNVEPGVLPTQIRRLVESRREVKKLMKISDILSEQYMQYNIRQLALKLTANSMYGCLGFTHSRFYAKPLAALVTLKGREILINTKELVSKLNYDVIYGDTDSIMINTNCLDYDQVFKIGHEIKKEINKKYKQVELDIDGVFKYLLLLKKKKYAAVLLSKNKHGEFVTTQELKGLDIVRRDWSQLAAEAGKFILNQILSEQSPDERVESIQSHLTKLKDDLKDGKMPLSLLTITKQLTKNPTEYADKNSQPHVQVALRLNSKNGRQYKKGDIVPYIICEDGTKNANTQRAYHIEELKSSDNLKVDLNYYLAHQLHPVISRICEPIDGLDSARIADFLGLDPSAYKQFKRDTTDNNELFVLENERDKYRQCTDFTFTCINNSCKTQNRIKEVFRTINKDTVTFLERCQNDQCNLRPMDYLPAILNELTVQMRLYNSKYYENWLICEDPACTNRTVKLPHYFTGGYPWCNLCEKGIMFREYTEKDLYYQISYFHYLFDINKQNVHKLKLNPQVVAAFHSLKECVEDVLSHSAYSVINLEHLFSFFDMKSKNLNKIKTEPMNLDMAPDIDLEDFASNADMEY